MEKFGELLLGWAAILAVPLLFVAIGTENAWYAFPMIFLIIRLVRFYRERKKPEEMSIAELLDSIRPVKETSKLKDDRCR